MPKTKNERISLQINYFDSDKRTELKNWAKKNGTSIRLLLHALLEKKDEIQPLIEKSIIKSRESAV
jgi:hypothetical protein